MKTVDVTYRMVFGDDGIIRSMKTISEIEVPETPHDVYAIVIDNGVRVRKTPITGTVISGLF